MEEFEQHLKSLWQEGGRDVAVSFLKRAVSPSTPLVELLAALQFAAVAPHLGEIALKDVLPGRPPAPHAVAAPIAHVPRPAPAKARRRRRTADELRVIGEAIRQMLVDEPGSLNTTQIVASLEQAGHQFDTMRVNALLRGLEQEEQVVNLGGKPKAWRASATLRQQHKA